MNLTLRTSIPSERALLGCVIAHPGLKHTIDLAPEDFYDKRHGVVWAALDGELDISGLVAMLDAKKQIDAAGGFGYVSCLADGLSNPAQAPTLARQIKQFAAWRRAQVRCASVVVEKIDFDQAAALVAEALEEMSGAVVGGGPVRVADALAVEVSRLKSNAPDHSVMTGLSGVDAVLGGFRTGQLILLAARPGVGKSALALQIARHAAGQGKRVLFISLEMATSDLMCRLLASEIGGIPLGRLIRGSLIPKAGAWDDTAEIDYVTEAEGKLKELPLWIESGGGVGLNELRIMARTHQAKHGLDLVIVDYLGLMRAPQANSRYAEVSALSRGLKLMAGELGIPLLVLSQFNRNIEYGESKRLPILSDLRDSGSLEQDADVVMFLDRQVSPAEDPADNERTTVLIAKNRNGAPDRCTLRYCGKYTRFMEGT